MSQVVAPARPRTKPIRRKVKSLVQATIDGKVRFFALLSCWHLATVPPLKRFKPVWTKCWACAQVLKPEQAVVRAYMADGKRVRAELELAQARGRQKDTDRANVERLKHLAETDLGNIAQALAEVSEADARALLAKFSAEGGRPASTASRVVKTIQHLVARVRELESARATTP